MSGDEVKQKIKPLNVSINELGRRIGMESSQISQALSVKDIKTGMLQRICEALGVGMEYFFSTNENITNTNIQNNNHGNIVNGNNSGAIVGNQINGDSEIYKKRIEELEANAKKQDERIDKLLSQIDKLLDSK